MGIQEMVGLHELTEYFDKWLGLAAGVSASASTAGAIVSPYIIYYLEEAYGWRGAILLLGAIELQTLVCGVLYRPIILKNVNKNLSGAISGKYKQTDLKEETPKTAGLTKMRNVISVFGERLSIFRKPVFSIFCVSGLSFTVAVSIVYTHIGAYMLTLGFAEHDAALFFMTVAVSSTVLRVLSGLATQIPKCNPLYICLSSTVVLGLITIMFSFYDTLPLLLMYGTFFGALNCPHIMLPVTVLIQYFNEEQLPVANGFIMFFFGIAYLIGGPVAGKSNQIHFKFNKMFI